MGLELAYLEFIHRAIDTTILPANKIDGSRFSMCELGNQRLRASAAALSPVLTGKEYFSQWYRHTALDRNGLDGALVVDFSQPLDTWETEQNPATRLYWTFDILTNSGFSEHIEDQFTCFENIHRLLNHWGVAVHLVPRVGSWPKHGYVWYSSMFFRALARAVGYVVVLEDDIAITGGLSHLVCVALQKQGPASMPFIDREEFDKIASDWSRRSQSGSVGSTPVDSRGSASANVG